MTEREDEAGLASVDGESTEPGEPPSSGDDAPADGNEHEPAGDDPKDAGESADEPDTPLADGEDALVAGDPLHTAMVIAIEMGLVITSTTGGTHATTSYHYAKPFRNIVIRGRRYQVGRAADIAKAGNPESLYRDYFHRVEKMRPVELYHDQMGYSWRNGKKANWIIGNHRDHVHVAF
jgi:hypothetical protein